MKIEIKNKSVENYPRGAESQQPLRIGINKTELAQSTSFLDDPDLRLIPRVADVKATSTEWVVEDMIAQGEYTLISGAPASMKSMLALSIADGIRRGTEIFGRQTVQKIVLYIDKEMPVSLIKERWPLLKIVGESNLYYWGYWFTEIPDVPHSVYVKLAERYQPVMIFDSLIRFHSLDENEATAMRGVSQFFRGLCNLGATVIVLHHQGKGSLEGGRSPFRGSSEIEAGCDIAYCLTKKKTENGLFLDVQCFKNRHGLEAEFRLRFDSGKGLFLPQLTEEERAIEKISKAIAEKPGASVTEIKQATGIPEGKLREILKKEEGIGWISKAGPHNKRQYFALNQQEQAQS